MVTFRPKVRPKYAITPLSETMSIPVTFTLVLPPGLESRFFEPPWKKKIGSVKSGWLKKLQCFTGRTKINDGLNYIGNCEKPRVREIGILVYHHSYCSLSEGGFLKLLMWRSTSFLSTVTVNNLHSDYRDSSLRQKNESIKVSEVAEIIGPLTIALE